MTTDPPPWGRPHHGEVPAVDEAAYGTVAHGNSQYGGSVQGPPAAGGYAYGQPPYGSPQYGQPQYGPPPYGQPAWGPVNGQWPYGGYPYAPAGPPRRNPRRVLGWTIAGVLVLVALLAAVFQAADAAVPDERVPAPAATELPTGLGDDPAMDRLAEACHDGAMTACDDLFLDSDLESDYEEYGDTCAGRRGAGAWAMCADVFVDAG